MLRGATPKPVQAPAQIVLDEVTLFCHFSMRRLQNVRCQLIRSVSCILLLRTKLFLTLPIRMRNYAVSKFLCGGRWQFYIFRRNYLECRQREVRYDLLYSFA